MVTREESKAMWSKRPSWELRNMVKALYMLPWLNTEEEVERRTIAEEILKDRGRAKMGLPKVERSCSKCGTESGSKLSRLGLCPTCTKAWVHVVKVDYELDDPTSVFSEFGPS